jgi:hypothetical protein
LHILATFPPQTWRRVGILLVLDTCKMKLRFVGPVCCALLASSAAGCVRTSDGSIEPAYAPAMGRAGPLPVVTLQPVRREVSDTLRYRPAPVPEPPAEAYASPPVYRAPQRRAVQVEATPLASTVACGPTQSAAGRVRVECR